jgi:lipoprotein-anchoring transpeptidase ErfK/SrfK
MPYLLRSIAAFALAIAGLALTPPSANAGPEMVSFTADFPLGSIVVVNGERRLYYVIGNGHALRYMVAVGTPQNQWTGQSFVGSKAVNPTWTPPDRPGFTMPGGGNNPLGARALYLGWTNYRIHGTNAPGSIGTPASHGCVRMFNPDVIDLYSRVNLGAPVFVVNELPKDQFVVSR